MTPLNFRESVWREHFPTLIAITFGLAGFLTAQSACACQEQPLIPEQFHVWGTFQPGAWSHVKIIVETISEEGKAQTSQREVIRTLHESTDKGYVLKVTTITEIGRADPLVNEQLVDNNWYVGQTSLIPDNPEGLERSIKVVDREIKCQIFEYRQGTEGAQTTHQDFFNPDVFPYLLKRVVLKPSPLKNEKFELSIESDVIETEFPVKQGDKLLSAATTRTVHRTAESSTVSIELVSREIPGGLLSKRTVERDKQGRLVRRETVELVDFGIETDEIRSSRRWPRLPDLRWGARRNRFSAVGN